MLIRLLLIYNFAFIFTDPIFLKRRPVKRIQRGQYRPRQRPLCGPYPGPGEDCAPAMCGIIARSGGSKVRIIRFVTLFRFSFDTIYNDIIRKVSNAKHGALRRIAKHTWTKPYASIAFAAVRGEPASLFRSVDATREPSTFTTTLQTKLEI